MAISRRELLIGGVAAAAVAAGGYAWLNSGSSGTLNLLAWSGYEEPDFLKPFEDISGVKVNVRTYANPDEMVSILSASPDAFDVVVVDPEYIPILAGRGAIDAMDYAGFDLSSYFPYFKDLALTKVDGKHFAVPIRFGVNSLVFNSDVIATTDVGSYAVLNSPKAKGRIGIWDWYLPNMGVISRSLGHAEPYNLSAEQFNNLKQALARLRPQVASIHASLPELVSALADKRIDLAPGVGEFVAAAAKGKGNPSINWAVPEEGGIMWVETLAICSKSQKKADAQAFIKWVTTPPAQALLAERKAYNSNTPNMQAYPLMSANQRKLLNAETAAQTEQLIAKLSVRTLPSQQSPQEWQEVWRNFKAT